MFITNLIIIPQLYNSSEFGRLLLVSTINRNYNILRSELFGNVLNKNCIGQYSKNINCGSKIYIEIQS